MPVTPWAKGDGGTCCFGGAAEGPSQPPITSFLHQKKPEATEAQAQRGEPRPALHLRPWGQCPSWPSGIRVRGGQGERGAGPEDDGKGPGDQRGTARSQRCNPGGWGVGGGRVGSRALEFERGGNSLWLLQVSNCPAET